MASILARLALGMCVTLSGAALVGCGHEDRSPRRKTPKPSFPDASRVNATSISCLDEPARPAFLTTLEWFVHPDLPAGAQPEYGLAVVVDADGRIVVAGEVERAFNDEDLVVWRYLPDGTPDASFGGSGWISHHDAAGGNGTDSGRAVALDSQGRIVVGGYSWGASTSSDMVVWRFLPDGLPDPRFGAFGRVVHDNAAGGAEVDQGAGLIVDSAGRIVVTGTSRGATTGLDLVVWRLRPRGTFDSSFAGRGWMVHDGAAGGGGDEVGRAVVEDPAGRIVVSGFSQAAGARREMAVWRLREDGRLDPSFAGQGWTTHSGSGGGAGGHAVAIDNRDRITIAGYGRNPNGQSDLAVWRFLESGVPDVDFGGVGWVTHDGPGAVDDGDAGEGLVIDPVGRIWVAGNTWRENGGDTDFCLWRLSSDGSLDDVLPGVGVLGHHGAAGGDRGDGAAAITLDSTCRPVAAGASNGPTGMDMTIWRLR